MAVIADYMDGNCHIVIHNDYMKGTPEDAEEIKRRLAEIYFKYRSSESEDLTKPEK
jgi:hypothetical protein